MVSVTGEAIKKIQPALWETDHVRVGVIAGGCSGLSYSLDIEGEEERRENDIVVKLGEVSLRMDPVSAEMLSSTTIDYVDSFNSSGFKFKNELATHTCGCGSSFSC